MAQCPDLQMEIFALRFFPSIISQVAMGNDILSGSWPSGFHLNMQSRRIEAFLKIEFESKPLVEIKTHQHLEFFELNPSGPHFPLFSTFYNNTYHLAADICMPTFGVESWISAVESSRSTNCATTTGKDLVP